MDEVRITTWQFRLDLDKYVKPDITPEINTVWAGNAHHDAISPCIPNQRH